LGAAKRKGFFRAQSEFARKHAWPTRTDTRISGAGAKTRARSNLWGRHGANAMVAQTGGGLCFGPGSGSHVADESAQMLEYLQQLEIKSRWR